MNVFKKLLLVIMLFNVMDLSAEKGPTIQILLVRSDKGEMIPMLIDPYGEKIRLTLGTFVIALASSWMEGRLKPQKSIPISNEAVALVRLDKEGEHLKAYLFDNRGREEPLNLGNLLSSAAQSFPTCVPQEIKAQTVDLKIFFAQDSKNYLQAYFQTEGTKEEVNLGSLIKEVFLLLNQCPQFSPPEIKKPNP